MKNKIFSQREGSLLQKKHIKKLLIVSLALVLLIPTVSAIMTSLWSREVTKTLIVSEGLVAGNFDAGISADIWYNNYATKLESNILSDLNRSHLAIFSTNIQNGAGHIKATISGVDGLQVTITGQYYLVSTYNSQKSVESLGVPFNIPLSTYVAVEFAQMMWEDPIERPETPTVLDANGLVLTFAFNTDAVAAGTHNLNIVYELGYDDAV